MVPPHDDIDITLSDRALDILRQRPWMYLAVVATVFGLGAWIYLGVRAAMVELAANNLHALLDAQVAVLDTWVGEKQINVARWADDPRVRRAAARLVRPPLADAAAERERLTRGCRSAERAAFLAAIESLRGGDVAIAVNLIDRGGTMVATRYDVFCGRTISETSQAALVPVLKGAPKFSAPVTEQERLGVTPAELGAALLPNSPERRMIDRPAVWFSAPVRDDSGAVVAVLNIAKPADARFSALLATARVGESGEAYAFDARGRMLSESRFRSRLEDTDKLGAGVSEILRLRLEDPDPEQMRPRNSLTVLIGTALARRVTVFDETGAATVPATDTGEVMVPYANYVGQRVVGAWHWLPRYEFGVAIEVSEAEAFAPLRRLQLVFGGVLAAAVVASLFLFVALGRIVRLRRERDKLLKSSGQVGNYELFEEIGQGGGARVYRARHRLLKRPTAVKIIHLYRSSDELRARFDREVKLTSQLMHPNTIEIFDFGRTPEGLPYYAMELLDGLTLEQLATRFGPFTAARTAHVLRAIAGALAEAHNLGLVHRDVTPSNIMLCHKGGEYDVPKLLDFGLIKDTRTPASRELTRMLTVLGTPPYLSPERIDKPDTADLRSDLYALGAVGYFLLAGKAPFEASTDLSLAYHVVHSAPVPITEAAPQAIPPELAELVMRCLAKRPDDRPQSAAEMSVVLDRIRTEVPWPQSAARQWWEAHPGAPATASA